MTKQQSIKNNDAGWLHKNFNKLKTYLSRPYNVITVVFIIMLVATVVFPLLSLLKDSITVHHGSETAILGQKAGTLTFAHWHNTSFSQSSINGLYKPLSNSIFMALLACFIAISFGGGLAFFVTRTNLPFKKLISVFFLFPYIMPSWSIAMFWEAFFKNSSVAAAYNQSGILEIITGIKVPEGMVYGFFPMAMVLGIHYAPFAYILIGGILRNMDANLEEAATILGASRLKVLRKVTLPILRPGIISTFLLVFSSSLSSYTVPAFLNKNNSFTTISIIMRSSFQNSATRGSGYVIAITLIIISMFILGINYLLTGKRKSFTTVTGKSGQISKINLRKMKYVIGGFFIVIVFFFSIVPLITFGIQSFIVTDSNGVTRFTSFYWTTSNQIETRINGDSSGILHNKTIWLSLLTSIGLSAIVAFIAGTVGILIGYAISHKRGHVSAGILSNLSFIPYLIPTLSFGATYFALSNQRQFIWLNESFLLLVLVGGVKFLPFASKSGTNAMLQVSKQIEEAAIIQGIKWHKRMFKILFPIQKASFMSGYLLPFISTMRELTLFVLLASSTSILTVVIQNFDVSGVSQVANGISFIMMLTIISINFLINKITGASIDKGIGG